MTSRNRRPTDDEIEAEVLATRDDPAVWEALAFVPPSPSPRPAWMLRNKHLVPQRRGVFVSYSHRDAKWLDRIRTMLSPLVREDAIDVWDDTHITPGTNWGNEIRDAIAKARVVVLLVSPSFLASSFIADEELPPLLRAAQEEGVKILWVLVSQCLYRKTPIAEFQAAHSISRPLDSLPTARRNQELLLIAEAVARTLQEPEQLSNGARSGA